MTSILLGKFFSRVLSKFKKGVTLSKAYNFNVKRPANKYRLHLLRLWRIVFSETSIYLDFIHVINLVISCYRFYILDFCYFFIRRCYCDRWSRVNDRIFVGSISFNCHGNMVFRLVTCFILVIKFIDLSVSLSSVSSGSTFSLISCRFRYL